MAAAGHCSSSFVYSLSSCRLLLPSCKLRFPLSHSYLPIRLVRPRRRREFSSCSSPPMADNGGGKSSSDEVVVKSPNDRKLYRHVVLRNGLCALLVHDPDIYCSTPVVNAVEDEDGDSEGEDEEFEDGESEEDDEACDSSSAHTKKAAAAMCVGVGSFSDPYEAQGLAHFLEHMLFMGSDEFPVENEYDSYLSKHGGSSNAYTETEHTCYYFDVKQEFLKEALERFSQFFISPLVKSEAMEREVLAIDSEFNQVLQSDDCRLQQLQCHTSVPGHPFNRFSWGNKKSLADAMENGVDLRERILKLFKDHYHGGLMKLVVIGGESLDVLEDWICELFSGIKSGHSLEATATDGSPIWAAGKMYRLEAIKDVNNLELSWKLPCLHKEYQKKPEGYFAHLLGHEGRGSLHYFLKNKGWITSISAGVGDEGLYRSSLAYIFSMSIYLTDSGLEKIYDIIKYIYQYLKLLRQTLPQRWVFKELQDIWNMEFRFVEEQPQDDYAVELAENLLIYPAEHVIYGQYAYREWDREIIMNILDLLSPENMRIDVISKLCDKPGGFLSEPWFGSKYMEQDISPSLMESWRDPPDFDASLRLPPANDFIPTNFNVHADSIANDSVSCPKCVLDEPIMKLWYMPDETFKLPRANAYFQLTLKDAYESVENCLLTELYVNLLKDELNEIIYQASIANLETSVSVSSDKLELKVCGFNDKLPTLLSKILAVARSFLPTEYRFKVIKESMERSLRNTNMKPLSHASYLRLQLLCKRFWDADEKLHCLRKIALDDLHAFIPKLISQVRKCGSFFPILDVKLHCLRKIALDDLHAFIPKLISQAYIEGLCHGNLLEEEVVNVSNIFKQNFCEQSLPVEMRLGEQIMCFPSQANLVRDVRAKNKSELNSAVELYYQIEQDNGVDSIRSKAFSDLFDEIVEEPLFNQLRTKEQLGYGVECCPRTTYRTLGFCFSVQSSEYDPIHLQERVDSFINGIRDLLEGLDNESFESYKDGLIAKLLEKDPSLAYQTNRFWSQIVDKRYMFDQSKKKAEELEEMSKSDLIAWYDAHFRSTSSKCRRLVTRVWGCNADVSKAAAHNLAIVRVIDDAEAFKSLSEFYPSVC